ncbi:MAG: hypothetical protein ACYDD7_03545 [Acidimicrobiales bacterium]
MTQPVDDRGECLERAIARFDVPVSAAEVAELDRGVAPQDIVDDRLPDDEGGGVRFVANAEVPDLRVVIIFPFTKLFNGGHAARFGAWEGRDRP